MAELEEEKELFCRAFITERAAEADNVSFGIVQPVFFTGKEDFAAQVGVLTEAATDAANAAAIENLLCDFVMTSYGRFEDTALGCADAPVVKLIYKFLIFQEFRRGLEVNTNAHNRHVATVLQIRNKFLRSRTIQNAPKIRHSAVTQLGDTVLNSETSFLPGVKGFYTNLQLIVEVF